jgi:hypothetical protein
MDSGLSRDLRRALTTGFRMACKGRRFDSPELPHHNHNTACSKSTVPSDVAAASRLPARAARTTPEHPGDRPHVATASGGCTTGGRCCT